MNNWRIVLDASASAHCQGHQCNSANGHRSYLMVKRCSLLSSILDFAHVHTHVWSAAQHPDYCALSKAVAPVPCPYLECIQREKLFRLCRLVWCILCILHLLESPACSTVVWENNRSDSITDFWWRYFCAAFCNISLAYVCQQQRFVFLPFFVFTGAFQKALHICC